MSQISPSSLLRFSLRLDAGISLFSGVLLCVSGSWMAARFDLAFGLLLAVGLICLPYAALLFWMARQARLANFGVLAIVVGNLLWADAALLLALGYGAAPNTWGQAYLATHVIATASFAVLQWLGLRRSATGASGLATQS
jgi:hypothetical protein